MFAVDDEESEMISLYGLSTFDLAPAHAEVPELWEVVVGGLGGPGWGPLRPGGQGGVVQFPWPWWPWSPYLKCSFEPIKFHTWSRIHRSVRSGEWFGCWIAA